MKLQSTLKALSPIQGEIWVFLSLLVSNSKMTCTISPQLKLLWDFIPVLIIGKVDQTSVEKKSCCAEDNIYPIICLWGTFSSLNGPDNMEPIISLWNFAVALLITVLNKSVPNLYAVNPHLNNTTSRLANWLRWYSCLNVLTNARRDDGFFRYYKLTLWAFGTGELIIRPVLYTKTFWLATYIQFRVSRCLLSFFKPCWFGLSQTSHVVRNFTCYFYVLKSEQCIPDLPAHVQTNLGMYSWYMS